MRQMGGEVIFDMMQGLVKEAFQKGLAPALEEFNKQAKAGMTEMAQASIRQSMDAALDSVLAESKTRLEAAAEDLAAQHLNAYRASIESMVQEAELRLSARLEHYEARLNTGADKICQTLAMRLAPTRTPQ